jgi:hypothetical protein
MGYAAAGIVIALPNSAAAQTAEIILVLLFIKIDLAF